MCTKRIGGHDKRGEERRAGPQIVVEEGNARRGRIEIDYFSQEDLDRIYEMIVGEAPE